VVNRYGRGYGASVADEMQTILNCNTRRQSLACPWWQGNQASCSNSYFIPKSTGFKLDALVFDGGHDFEKSDAKQLFQGVNLVGHLALQGCPISTCRNLFRKDAYQATLDAFYLMNQGWCPAAVEAGFGRDKFILMASLFSTMNYNPKTSVMASGALPALVAIVFRYIRCQPEDVLFLASVASTRPFFQEEFEPFFRTNFLVCG
jgi:hypothetical protein